MDKDVDIFNYEELRKHIVRRLSKNDIPSVVKIMLAHPSLDIGEIMCEIGDPGYGRNILAVYLELSRVLINMVKKNHNNILVMYSVLSKFNINIDMDNMDKVPENPLNNSLFSNEDVVKFGEYIVLCDIVNESFAEMRLVYSSLLDFITTAEHHIDISFLLHIMTVDKKHLSNETLYNLFNSHKLSLVTTLIGIDIMGDYQANADVYIDNLLGVKSSYLATFLIGLYEYERDGHIGILHSYVSDTDTILILKDRLIYHINDRLKNTITQFISSSLGRPELSYETVLQLEDLLDSIKNLTSSEITDRLISTKYIEPHHTREVVSSFLTYELSLYNYVQKSLYLDVDDLLITLLIMSSIYAFNCNLVALNKIEEVMYVYSKFNKYRINTDDIIDGTLYRTITKIN